MFRIHNWLLLGHGRYWTFIGLQMSHACFQLQVLRVNSYATYDEAFSFVVRLAKLAVDRVLTAECETAILYPKSGGNLHCFTAVTPCAILDILTPPYKEDASRKCTYYIDYPYSNFGN